MILVSFEGIDGCGKTTIINEIKKTLDKTHNVYLSYEPGNIFGEIAKFGNDKLFLPNSNILLWWLSRLYEQNLNEFRSANIVLKDRYYDSSFVYQNLLNNKTLFEMNYNECFIVPNITFIFKIDINIAISRILEKNKFDQYEDDDYNKLKHRQQEFLKLPYLFPERNIKIIDVTNKSILDIHNECLKYI